MKRVHVKSVLVIVIVLLLSGCNSDKNNITSEDYVIEKLIEYDNSQVDGVLVKVLTNEEEIIYGFEVSGHANYSEYGSDIVCSAISAIAQNAVQSIEAYTEDEIKTDINEGYMLCILPEMKKGIGSKEACVLLKSAVIGFYSIEDIYNEYLSVFKVTEIIY